MTTPQQKTLPVPAATPQVDAVPALMLENVRGVPFDEIGNPAEGPDTPLPSCPEFPFPQQKACPYESRTHV
jgi:hypothetical protein